MNVAIGITIVNLLILGCNIIVLALSVKLYTEYVKDKSINAKKEIK